MKSSASSNPHIIFIFIDGVGMGENQPAFNPMALSKTGLFMPDGKTELPFGGIKLGLDPLLGIPGLPQSATGQTSIYTGFNAPEVIGHHLFGFPNQQLRELLKKQSLFVRLKSFGRNCRFLNGFRPVFFTTPEIFIKMRMSATTEMNRAAELPFTSLADIKRGEGLYHEYSNRILRRLGFRVPLFSAEDAAAVIINESRKYDLLLYEYFMTDNAGHSRNLQSGRKEVEKIERLVHNVAEKMDRENTILIVASDHGNLEDLRTKSHTYNKSFFALWAKSADVSNLKRITDIAPLVLKLLNVRIH